MRNTSRVATLIAVAAASLIFSGCDGGGSTAADSFIAQAEDPEERAALTEARDDIDAMMKKSLEELDQEVERLRKENEELKARLAKKKSGV